MKKLSHIIIAAAIAVLSLGVIITQHVYAGTCPTGSIRKEYTNSLAECNVKADTTKSGGLVGMIQTIINVVLSIVGIIAVVVVIFGGFTYMTSAGDPGKITKAKNTIMYGIIGLIIALLAYAIVNFVMENVFSTTKKEAETSEPAKKP